MIDEEKTEQRVSADVRRRMLMTAKEILEEMEGKYVSFRLRIAAIAATRAIFARTRLMRSVR